MASSLSFKTGSRSSSVSRRSVEFGQRTRMTEGALSRALSRPSLRSGATTRVHWDQNEIVASCGRDGAGQFG